MTALPLLLSPSSILSPLSSDCAFLLAKKKPASFSEMLFRFFKLKKNFVHLRLHSPKFCRSGSVYLYIFYMYVYSVYVMNACRCVKRSHNVHRPSHCFPASSVAAKMNGIDILVKSMLSCLVSLFSYLLQSSVIFTCLTCIGVSFPTGGRDFLSTASGRFVVST